MVKARKINVVDLNEIKSVDHQAATHVETLEPVEETPPTPEPLVEEPKDNEPETKHEPIIQEAPKEAQPMKKCDEKATCAFCNKVMSVKALRYSHDKNCKGKQQPEATARSTTVRNHSPEKADEPPTPRHSIPEASIIKPKLKPTRAEVRQQRLNSLVSQAF
jgi:hypothetical protein